MKIDRFYTSRCYPEKEIEQCWNAGYSIIGVSYGNGQWVLTVSDDSDLDNQQWNTSEEFPSQQINDGWNQGKDISFLGYGVDRWVVFMSGNTGYIDQIWRSGSRFPGKDINTSSKEGYRVTHLAYGNNRWVVVMAKDTGYTEQLSGLYSDFPKDTITKGWDDGYDITSLVAGNGYWGLIMSKNSGLGMQRWINNSDFPSNDVNSWIKEGYSITALTFGAGSWSVVLSETRQGEVSDDDTSESEESGSKSTDTSIENNPEADRLSEAGVQFLDKNKYDKAINQFTRALAIQPDHLDALAGLATAYTWVDQGDQALKYYEKAFELDQSIPILTSNIIITYNNFENYEQILDVVKKTAPGTIDEIMMPDTYNVIGIAYFKTGDYENAIRYYNKALKLDPKNEIIKDNLDDAKQQKDAQVPAVQSAPGSVPLSTQVPEMSDELLLETSLKELQAMIELERIKIDVDDLMKFLSIEKLRKQRGLMTNPVALHSVFSGPPGTGKTTVARLLGKIFKSMGLLKKGHVVEVDRSMLVAEFIGQTAVKTNKVIDAALDGILFIDEAYTLVPDDDSRDFGREAVETLLKRMEDNRERLIVIVAGYTDEMKRFIDANPGLQSRFTRYFFFEDFKPEQLSEIFIQTCTSRKFRIEPLASDKLLRYTSFIYRSRIKSFGNARSMRNLFEEVLRLQGSRLAKLETITDDDLITITEADITDAVKDEFPDDKQETIDDVLKELNELVGLENVKQDVNTLVNYIKIEKLRREKGMVINPISLHTVFFGPPGTGKTTVARLLGRIFKAMGLISLGHVIEVSRADLVAPYVGQTAARTMKVVDSAMHGILFIDEAYTLTPANGSNDFGQESLDTLLKRMEDDRERLIVVVAGYTDEMQRFLESNPGLKSRFNRFFYFNDYRPEELTSIFTNMCESRHFTITPEIETKIYASMQLYWDARDKTFGNGRMVRNLFEKLVQVHSDRVSKITNPDENDLSSFSEEDVEKATSCFGQSCLSEHKSHF